MSNENIIIRREAEEDHHAHHGGGWKVAYADFMTAMMAFFLLLWILSASEDDQLVGLAAYFSPVIGDSTGSGQGVLDGQPTADNEMRPANGQPEGLTDTPVPTFGQVEPLAVFDSRLRHEQAPDIIVEYADEAPPAPSADASGSEAARDAGSAGTDTGRSDIDAVRDEIETALAALDEDGSLSARISMTRTPEGLEVQIVDHDGGAMFDKGSARLDADTERLIDIISAAISSIPNRVIIAGHTDATPFSTQTRYDNWELSTERAHATRRALVSRGIDTGRFARVSGFADTDPLLPDDPFAPENRRIRVLILGESQTGTVPN